MPQYNSLGWVWSGLGTVSLSSVRIRDNDPEMSPYFTNDNNERLRIDGTTYSNPQGGTYRLSFTDSSGNPHVEDLLLFNTGSNFVFVLMPGSDFDDGSTVTGLLGWQSWTTGFLWEDVLCFAAGTLIATPEGMVPVETLMAGDQVITRDNGVQRLVWAGGR